MTLRNIFSLMTMWIFVTFLKYTIASTCTQQSIPYVMGAATSGVVFTNFDYNPTTGDAVACGTTGANDLTGRASVGFIQRYDSGGSVLWGYSVIFAYLSSN